MISKSDHFEMCLNIWCTLLCTCICLFFGLVIFFFSFFVAIFMFYFGGFFSAEAGHGRIWTAWTEAFKKKKKKTTQSWRQSASRGSEWLFFFPFFLKQRGSRAWMQYRKQPYAPTAMFSPLWFFAKDSNTSMLKKINGCMSLSFFFLYIELPFFRPRVSHTTLASDFRTQGFKKKRKMFRLQVKQLRRLLVLLNKSTYVHTNRIGR